MHLQKSQQHQGREVIASDEEGNLNKGIMVFIIVELQKYSRRHESDF